MRTDLGARFFSKTVSTRIKLIVTALLLLSLSSVCACQRGFAPGSSADPAADASTVSTSTSSVSQLSHLASLPACDSILPIKPSPDAAGDEPGFDCVLKSSDKLKLTFEVLRHPAETIKVFDTHGQERQTFTQKVEQPVTTIPLLEDLDGDGRDEILVPVLVGASGGMEIEVWRATGNSDQFHSSGTLTGQLQFWKTEEGMFANYAHDTATSGNITFYRFVQDKLEIVAVLELKADVDYDAHRVLGVKCALSDSTGLSAVGMDPATAEKRLCAEPWIQTIYSN